METLCHRGGHTKASTGASDKYGLNELTEDRKIDKRVAELLSPYYRMVDCTPPESYAFPQELNYGINLSNTTKPKMFYSIHFNSTIGAKGSEICIYPGTKLTTDVGNRILKNLESLGFVNRGIKPRTDLGETCNVDAPSMIIEVCFVQQPDANLYKKLGVERVARAIANGIDSRVSLKVPVKKPSKPTNKPVTKEVYRIRKSWKDVDSQKGAYSILNNAKEECDKHKGYFVFDSKGNIVYPKAKPIEYTHRNIIVYNNGAEADKYCAEYFAMILNSKDEDCEVLDYNTYKLGKKTARSLFAVGGSLEGKFKYDKLFKGENRNLTALSMLSHLKTKY